MASSLETQINEFLAKWNALEADSQQGFERELRVAVYGLLKAGKSSLLNVLTGHYSADDEVFKTGVVRATVENKSYSHDGITYRDTPGLDANDDDTQEARSGVEDVDVLMFVHNARWELDGTEMQYLSECARRMGSRVNSDMLLILSQIDQSPEYLKVKEVVEGQLRELNIHPQIFCVSSTLFARGTLENKPPLANMSNISSLIDKIGEFKAHSSEVLIEKNLASCNALLEQIDPLLQSCEDRMNEIIEFFAKPFKQFDLLQNEYYKRNDELHKQLEALKEESKHI